jgi:hypothetical protein
LNFEHFWKLFWSIFQLNHWSFTNGHGWRNCLRTAYLPSLYSILYSRR